MFFFDKKNQKKIRQIRGTTLGRNRLVYSYYQKRIDTSDSLARRTVAKQAKTTSKSRFSFFKSVPAMVCTIVIMICIGYQTILTPNAQVKITDKKSPGAILLKEPIVYQQATEHIFKNSLLNRFKVTINTSKIAEELQKQFPELGGVTVIIPIIGDTPTLVVRPITPSFVLSSNNETFVVNESGVAVARLNELSDASKLQLVSVIDKSGIKLSTNKPVLSADQTLFINTVIAQLKLKNIKIKNIVIPLSAYDLQVRIENEPYYVRMNMLGDPKLQTGSFLALKKRVDKGKILVKEYVDVRVEERVYYK